MEVKNAELCAVGVTLSQYPADGAPEIAFAGKSNVGKSTLINTLMNRKGLARTSGEPGKTRTINFYGINGSKKQPPELYFVDLPGYGYARAPKTEVAKWGKMTEEYLYKRHTLKAILLLIDIRHEPGANDKMMYEWLVHYGYDIVIIATKSDKLNRSQIPKALKVIKDSLSMRKQDKIIPFSGHTKAGREEILALFDELLDKAD